MPRRASPAADEHAARQAGIRTIARAARPVYHGLRAVDARWYVFGYPWLSIDSNDLPSAVEATRPAVREWRAVSRDAFNVEIG